MTALAKVGALGAVVVLLAACAGPEAEIAREQSAQGHYDIGLGALAENNLPKAISELRLAVQENPRLARHHHALGNAYVQKQQWDQAIEAFRRALANPQYTNPERAYMNLGNVYMFRGQHDLAAQEFRKLLDVIPQSADGHFFLGRTLMAQGKLAEARREFEEAIRLDGTVAVFHLELGIALLREGRRNEARESFRRALSLSPTGPDAEEARRHLRELN